MTGKLQCAEEKHFLKKKSLQTTSATATEGSKTLWCISMNSIKVIVNMLHQILVSKTQNIQAT